MVIAMLGTTRSEWPSVITMKGAANDATSWMTLAMVTPRSKRAASLPRGRGVRPSVAHSP